MKSAALTAAPVKSDDEHTCTACGASFVPSYDSGSRLLTVATPGEKLTALLCGGCYSKWAYGKTVTLREQA